MQKKVVVTGGCGFIGSRIVQQLINKGYEVHIVDNLSTGSTTNLKNTLLENLHLWKVDILDTKLFSVIKDINPDYIIHQAAQVSVPKSISNPYKDAEINILGSINLIKIANEINVKKFIFASTAAVYGNLNKLSITEDDRGEPTSNYGLSKRTIEKYLELNEKNNGLKYCVLRYSNVYGFKQCNLEGMGVISKFYNALITNSTPYIYGDGEQIRDFVYVADVAKANILALESEHTGIYNVSSNEKTTINEAFNTIKTLVKKNVEPIYSKEQVGDIKVSVLSNQKIKEELGWRCTTSLVEGISQIINIEKKHRKQYV
ncbi:NAD-dependent epimerase/dehydratase family protein [Bacillus cereus]|uniref:NAD-dependent epimerase/dehydratase family protein n=1 Tax=Bacillus cereus TaxID=1396 RepID=UPI0013040C71|nr:NAD-dependent epimerase/dehydratase family protein [Bacillus cereus]